MSVSLWPAFEDGQKHSLWDEGVLVLSAYEDLDAIGSAAGYVPLSAFDQHADVPEDVIARLAEEAQDEPDLSGFPVVWHDPADAVATLDVLLSAIDPDPAWAGTPDDLVYCLEAFRQSLQQAVMRHTRFNFVVA
jgi:hypothetical protein